MPILDNLQIEIYADGAELNTIETFAKYPFVKGFTTNPSLMKSAGINDFETFGCKVLSMVPNRSVSLEVFADELTEMKLQARRIASWGDNACVKIPITNTKGESTCSIIKQLCDESIPLNITAIFTIKQVVELIPYLGDKGPIILSVFAGRIADTGCDPEPIMQEIKLLTRDKPNIKILWASSREVINIIQAERIGIDIITLTPSIISKLEIYGKDLEEYSLETVQSFYRDAHSAGLDMKIESSEVA